MPVSKDDVKRIAQLSKLTYSDTEMEDFVRHFQEILDYFEQLKLVPTHDVEPTYHALEGSEGTPVREDQTRPSLGGSLAVANAPRQADCQFRVPKVIE